MKRKERKIVSKTICGVLVKTARNCNTVSDLVDYATGLLGTTDLSGLHRSYRIPFGDWTIISRHVVAYRIAVEDAIGSYLVHVEIHLSSGAVLAFVSSVEKGVASPWYRSNDAKQ